MEAGNPVARTGNMLAPSRRGHLSPNAGSVPEPMAPSLSHLGIHISPANLRLTVPAKSEILRQPLEIQSVSFN